MSNSIQEALAAVQRKINEQRMKNSLSNHNSIQEAVPLPTNRPVPRPAVPTVRPNSATPASAPGSTSAASSGDESNSSYWNQEAARNKSAGNKPLPNEFNVFGGNKPAAFSAPAPSSRPSATPRPAVSDPKVLQQQKDLISKGYNIKADGIMGPKTAAAAKDFGSAASRDDQEQGAAMRAAATKSNASDALKKAQATSAGTDENGNMMPPTRPAAAPTSGQSASGSVSATPAPAPAPARAASAPAPAPAAPAPAPAQVQTGVAPKSPAELAREKELNSVETKPNFTTSVGNAASAAGSAISDTASSLINKVKNVLPSNDDMKNVPESGPSKGKKKMSESTLISAFLRLQETKAGNVFEAAKKAKKDWDGDGKIESEKDEVWGSRFKAAKKAGKMEEAAYPPGAGKDTAKDKDPDMLKGSPDEEAAEKKIPVPPKKPAEMKEETDPGFSEAELAHFEAVIARKDQKGKDRGIGDTVASEDLTDEYIYEMARKPGENRGVKAGVPRGPYKNTKVKRGGVEKSETDLPDEGPKDVQHVLHQIRHNPEDEHGFKTIAHPASSPEAPVTKRIHRSELHGFYDAYHDTEKPREKEKAYGDFLSKQFGDSRATKATSRSVSTDLSKVENANLKGGAGKVSLGGSKLVGGKK